MSEDEQIKRYRFHFYESVMSNRQQGLMGHTVVVRLDLDGEVRNHKTQL